MSEADRVFLKVALAVLWIAWLAVVGLVVWICAQWRKERKQMRARTQELDAWIGDAMTNPQCYKSGAMERIESVEQIKRQAGR